MKLPWSTSEYRQLEPGDLSGEPPTPEVRIRVVAAMATASRDSNMRDPTKRPPFNAETIRLALTMDSESWRKMMPELREALQSYGYDVVDGLQRFKQVTEGKKS